MGDARFTAWALRLASDGAAHPDLFLASLSAGDWASLNAGYRFFDNPQVTPAHLLAPHQATPWERCTAASIVFMDQDTPYFHCTRDAATKGLGPIGSGPDPGLLWHRGLALTTEGVPLGLVAQMIWARDPVTHGKSAQRQQLPIEDNESYRWVPVPQPVAASVPAGAQTVLMGDRESDNDDVFMAPRDPLPH